MEYVNIQVETEIKLDFDDIVDLIGRWLKETYPGYHQLKHVKIADQTLSIRFITSYKNNTEEPEPFVYAIEGQLESGQYLKLKGCFNYRGELYIIRIDDSGSVFLGDSIYTYLYNHEGVQLLSMKRTDETSSDEGVAVEVSNGVLKVG